MIREETKRKYKECLAQDLSKYYNMSLEKASDVVAKSTVSEILEDDGDAEWQMHQPLETVVDNIFCEYRGLPVNL
jgi:hypothetical protein